MQRARDALVKALREQRAEALGSDRAAQAARRLERQLAALDELVEERRLLDGDVELVAAVREATAAGLEQGPVVLRELAAELDRWRDLLAARAASFDAAHERARVELGGAAVRLPWRERLAARRHERTLEALERMVQRTPESEAFVGTQNWADPAVTTVATAAKRRPRGAVRVAAP